MYMGICTAAAAARGNDSGTNWQCWVEMRVGMGVEMGGCEVGMGGGHAGMNEGGMVQARSEMRT